MFKIPCHWLRYAPKSLGLEVIFTEIMKVFGFQALSLRPSGREFGKEMHKTAKC